MSFSFGVTSNGGGTKPVFFRYGKLKNISHKFLKNLRPLRQNMSFKFTLRIIGRSKLISNDVYPKLQNSESALCEGIYFDPQLKHNYGSVVFKEFRILHI